MASSNRHWPSMFKSKPCNSHHQWQHDINSSSLMSTGCHRTSYSSVPACEERTPEPKPRWNPKPEQIRILEAIFNSGMVNPPREEIRKIRAQLQEYGQVGDANVFYWFQNRKSRSKHKLRHLQNTSKLQQQQQQQNISSPAQTLHSPQVLITSSISTLTAPTSSSSSSEKSSPKLGCKRTTGTLSLTSPSHVLELSNSPTGSVNHNMYFQAQNNQFLAEPFFFHPVHQAGAGGGIGGFSTSHQGLCFSDISNIVLAQDNTVGPCTSLMLSEIMNTGASKKVVDHHLEEKNLMTRMQPQFGYTITPPITHTIGLAAPIPTTTPSTTETNNSVTVPFTIDPLQGDQAGPVDSGTSAAIRSTVFINDVPFEVALGPFNVREAFGDDVLLVHSSGQPVLTNEWGVTLQSLQHGGFYYLVPLPITEHI